jgi:hypothetical protein
VNCRATLQDRDRSEYVVLHSFIFMTSKGLPRSTFWSRSDHSPCYRESLFLQERARRCISKRAENVSCATQQVGPLCMLNIAESTQSTIACSTVKELARRLRLG